jgi:hypothetical protein
MSYSDIWHEVTHTEGRDGLVLHAVSHGMLMNMIAGSVMSVPDKAIELARRINDPRYAAGASTISQELHDLQLSDQGWLVAYALLEHQNFDVNFYGALTLQIKLNNNRLVS